MQQTLLLKTLEKLHVERALVIRLDLLERRHVDRLKEQALTGLVFDKVRSSRQLCALVVLFASGALLE